MAWYGMELQKSATKLETTKQPLEAEENPGKTLRFRRRILTHTVTLTDRTPESHPVRTTASPLFLFRVQTSNSKAGCRSAVPQRLRRTWASSDKIWLQFRSRASSPRWLRAPTAPSVHVARATKAVVVALACSLVVALARLGVRIHTDVRSTQLRIWTPTLTCTYKRRPGAGACTYVRTQRGVQFLQGA
jgi:hypothetical protein